MRTHFVSAIILFVFLASTALGTTDENFGEARRLLNSGRYVEAVNEFSIIVDTEPDGSESEQNARYWIGQCYLRMERYDDALEQFERVVVDYPKSPIVPVSRLMMERVKKEKESARLRTGNMVSESETLTDPNTGAVYRKVATLTGKSDVIEYTTAGFSLSPDARFLLWEVKVIPLDGREPFDLVDTHAGRGVWSPDMSKVAFYSEGIWMIPISPETGRPAAEAREMFDGSYRYQPPSCWSSDSKKIAFRRGGNIYVMSVEDGSVSQVTYDATTTGSVWKYAMSWSHDGKTFAYSAYSHGKWNIWLASADGRTLMKTIETKQTVKPFWSSDDKWLYYCLYEKLYLFDIQNRREYSIDLPKGMGTFLGPSPDGKRMLFYQPSYDFNCTLKVASSQGGPSLELGRQVKLWLGHYSWSPDSSMVLNEGENSDGDPALWMLPLADEPFEMEMDVPNRKKAYPNCLSPDCSRLLVLSERDDDIYNVLSVPVSLKDGKVSGEIVEIFKGWNSIPVVGEKLWSPDGKNIVLVHEGDIWVASADGKKLEQRTDNPEIEFFPSWSPDGKEITYSKSGSLWMLPLSGGGPKQLKNVSGYAGWFPDSREITVVSGKKISAVSVDDGSTREICDLSQLEYDRVADAQWSPDGRRLALIASNTSEDKPSGVFVYGLADGNLIRVADDDLSEWKYSLSWSPDGKWLAYNTEENVKSRSQSIVWESDMDGLLSKCETREVSEEWETITGHYSYAVFRDAESDAIRSDGNGQHADYSISDDSLPKGRGEDWVDAYFQDGELVKLRFFAGRMQWHHRPAPPSDRKVKFNFDIAKPSKMLEDYEGNRAVFDILTRYRDGDRYVHRDLNSPMSLHAVASIAIRDDDEPDRITFMVDPSPKSPPKPPPVVDAPDTDIKAITQTRIDDFYNDDENGDYLDTGDHNPGYENNQIIYMLDYGPKGFNIETIVEPDGRRKWVFTTTDIEPVKLCVRRAIRDDEGKPMRWDILNLAQYDTVPCQFIISEGSLADHVFQR